MRRARARDGGLHRVNDRASQIRHEQPKKRVHRGHGAGNPASDAKAGTGEDLYPRASRSQLFVQRVPFHEKEHTRESVSVTSRPGAAARDVSRAHGARAQANRSNARAQLTLALARKTISTEGPYLGQVVVRVAIGRGRSGY